MFFLYLHLSTSNHSGFSDTMPTHKTNERTDVIFVFDLSGYRDGDRLNTSFRYIIVCRYASAHCQKTTAACAVSFVCHIDRCVVVRSTARHFSLS